MKDYSHIYNAHPSYIDEVYKQYKTSADSVDQDWRLFFEGFEFGDYLHADTTDSVSVSSSVASFDVKELGVLMIIHGFRSRGHLLSTTNPIKERRDRKPHLDLRDYNLSESDLDKVFQAGNEIGLGKVSLREIIAHCRILYAQNIGVEIAQIEDRERRIWLQETYESRKQDNSYGLTIEEKKRILEKLNGAVIFERFLHTKYVGQKRFSLEGGETTIAALDAIINSAADLGVEECVIGMAHRGRLNVLANIMGKTYEQIFNEFESDVIPDLSFGDGDVKYHLGFSSQVSTSNGKKIELKLAPNPSHLESVDPVVEGFARAKADILYGSEYDKILPILIHGDAAVVGQGVVYETVQMSQLPGYSTGGTVHYVINNQIGFTTDYEDARSSTYCTAAAGLVQAPVFHVNGDDPEAVIFAAKLAMEYRQKFNSDVFIDMVCYRRHGHNEGDDPKFTQPEMYEIIKNHPNPREIFVKKLFSRNEIEQQLAEKMEKDFWNQLQDRLNLVKETELPYNYQEPEEAWRSLKRTVDPKDFEKSPDTHISREVFDHLLEHISTIPNGLKPLSKVNRLFKGVNKLKQAEKLDWAMAELLCYGSILSEGKDVRMSGQDVKRGTFSHRHAIFYDMETFEPVNRLDNISKDQGKFRIFNSLLSEFAVLGFEYGYSLATPNSLVIWEAQFGDFYNGAQTIVDQYISAAESKWQRMSGLVMFLPHGYAGQGPEHSSARLERFLQMTSEYNITITNITTPANLFHALRRQLARPFRKPMINMSPKSVLRHPMAVSDYEEFYKPNGFLEVIDDDKIKASTTKRLLLCSGKIYYDLLNHRETNKIKDTAIVRLEQLYPFPKGQIDAIFKKYGKAKRIWVQEEPGNMGSWDYLLRYWRRDPIELVARKSSASPATGYKKYHEKQQTELIEKAFSS